VNLPLFNRSPFLTPIDTPANSISDRHSPPEHRERRPMPFPQTGSLKPH
jgi:hypothetical protein